MQVGDLVRDPIDPKTLGIIIGEVLQGCDRWFVQWNNGDMYSVNSRHLEVINASR